MIFAPGADAPGVFDKSGFVEEDGIVKQISLSGPFALRVYAPLRSAQKQTSTGRHAPLEAQRRWNFTGT